MPKIMSLEGARGLRRPITPGDVYRVATNLGDMNYPGSTFGFVATSIVGVLLGAWLGRTRRWRR